MLIAKTNLDYTTIKSPSDGVIIDRRVNVGQTVVASFNAPGLFLIAKDSRQMQVWASVGEADIGDIRPGLPARFTVKACLDESFEGRVAQVRMSPTQAGDAVKYTVVVAADNFGSMLPDMTANLQFEVERRFNVLLLPNDALRRLPHSPQTGSEAQATAMNDGAKAEGRQERPLAGGNGRRAQNRQVFQRAKSGPSPLGKRWRPGPAHRRGTGRHNGSMTEVRGKNVREGMEVILAEACLNDGH